MRAASQKVNRVLVIDVGDVVERLKKALEPEYVVLGGGNARRIKDLPPDTRMGDNRNAFVGGSRLWEKKAQPFDGNEGRPAAKIGDD
jgi:hypothetical protein